MKSKQKNPNLCELIDEIAGDNNMTSFQKRRQDYVWPEGSDVLEEAASKLSKEDKETVAAGDQDEAAVILKKIPNGKKLDEFLNEVFDGDFRTNFFKW